MTAPAPLAPAATNIMERPDILRLPDELLLKITRYITGHDASETLVHLALTDRRFSQSYTRP